MLLLPSVVGDPVTDEELTISLQEAGVSEDPGTHWHPKPEKWDGELLPDLSAVEVDEHTTKPEVSQQPDAGRSLAAEDSETTPDGEV